MKRLRVSKPDPTTAAIRNGVGGQEPARDAEMARYLADSARAEITKINDSATALLTALSVVGTAAGAGVAVLAGQGHHVVSLVVLAGAAVSLLGSFVEVVRALRPRLPRRGGGTGWPVLLGLTPGWEVSQWVRDLAAFPADFHANDAKTLAEIAYRKHALIRRATTLLLVGVSIGLVGGVLYAVGI